jgi:Uncharacterized conserved protein
MISRHFAPSFASANGRSIRSAIQFAWHMHTGKLPATNHVFTLEWKQACQLIVQTFREQQRLKGPGPYSFQRTTDNPIDTPPSTVWVIPPNLSVYSLAFRPSDDACVYPFLIPANMFAVVALNQLAEILSAVSSDKSLAADCRELGAASRRSCEQLWQEWFDLRL